MFKLKNTGADFQLRLIYSAVVISSFITATHGIWVARLRSVSVDMVISKM